MITLSAFRSTFVLFEEIKTIFFFHMDDLELPTDYFPILSQSQWEFENFKFEILTQNLSVCYQSLVYIWTLWLYLINL